MNRRSALNNGFYFLALGAIFIGLTKVENIESLPLWLFLCFFVFFRTKMWLDDAHHFSSFDEKSASQKQKWLFKIGLVIAIIAWSLWAIAGYSLSNLSSSYFYILISIVLLTAWILVSALANWDFGDHGGMWVFVNVLYIFVLILLLCESCIFPFDKQNLVWLLVLGTVLDFLISGSLEHFTETKE